MTIIGVDDTDSRTEGMCTTYVGHRIAEELEARGFDVSRVLLVRLNPSAKYKTRGNAAVAIHTNADTDVSLEISSDLVSELSADSSERTNPSVVVSQNNSVSEQVSNFTTKALTELCSIEESQMIIEDENFLSYYRGNGRGRIGCLAAIGSWSELDDWTYENITYRQSKNRGTERHVNYDSVFRWADKTYPSTWDTVDRRVGKGICVPTAPGPILYGIRGDSKSNTEIMGRNIKVNEPIESSRTFTTNQGTDYHIIGSESISSVSDNSSYSIVGEVCSEPSTKEGGHVFFRIKDETGNMDAVAFEPTKHFRDIVRSLREGDKIRVLGEVSNTTIKIEKMKILSMNQTELVNPTCDECNISMSSAGRNQGYRCRKCKKTVDSKVEKRVSRSIEEGWYEVPPCARRHISKPLVRGDFSGDKHIFK